MHWPKFRILHVVLWRHIYTIVHPCESDIWPCLWLPENQTTQTEKDSVSEIVPNIFRWNRSRDHLFASKHYLWFNTDHRMEDSTLEILHLSLFMRLVWCFMSQSTAYNGHVGTVISPEPHFYLDKLDNVVNQYHVHMLLLVTDNSPSWISGRRRMAVESTFRSIICTLLVEGIMRNNSVKLFWIRTSGSGGNAAKRYFLSRALVALLFIRAEPFMQFW